MGIDHPGPDEAEVQGRGGKEERAALEEFAKEYLDPRNSAVEIPSRWAKHIDGMMGEVAVHGMAEARPLRLPGSREGRAGHPDSIAKDRELITEQRTRQELFRHFANECINGDRPDLLNARIVDGYGEKLVGEGDGSVEEVAGNFEQWLAARNDELAGSDQAA